MANRHRSFLVGAFVVAGALVCVGAIRNAHGEEAAGPVYRDASKATMSVETLENYTVLKLSRIYFSYEASDLSSKERTVLNQVLKSVSGRTELIIELRGYTDAMEYAQRGTALSTRRSQTIAEYLIANGIPSGRILSVALDCTGDEDKLRNPEHRRVDVRVFAPAAASLGAQQPS